LIENLKKQYEANKEHYDQKLLDLWK
jgi:hypothetical protein